MNRRAFLQAIGASVAVTAGGIELLRLTVPKRTFFLPPAGGWCPEDWCQPMSYAFGPGKLYLDGWLIGSVTSLDFSIDEAGTQPPIATIPRASARILSANLTRARRVLSDDVSAA